MVDDCALSTVLDTRRCIGVKYVGGPESCLVCVFVGEILVTCGGWVGVETVVVEILVVTSLGVEGGGMVVELLADGCVRAVAAVSSNACSLSSTIESLEFSALSCRIVPCCIASCLAAGVLG